MAVCGGGDVSVDVLYGGGVEAHDGRLLGCQAVRNVPVAALVVVGLAGHERVARGLGQSLVLVDGRVARDVVVAVLLGRGERRGGVAVRAARPRVGEEEDLTVRVGVIGDVVRHLSVGVGEKFRDAELEARAKEDANGEGQGDGAGAVICVDVEGSQRDEGRRYLDRHVVSGPRVVLVRVANLDEDVAEVAGGVERVSGLALEHVGIHVAVGGLGVRVKDLVGEDDVPEVIHLHIVAELVGEGHVARLGLHAIGCVRGVAGRVRDLLGDVVEDGLEIGGVGCRLVEGGILGAGAEVPAVATPRGGIGGIGVVAGNRLHKLVLVARPTRGNIGRRVRPVEDADGVNGCSGTLHGFCRLNGARGNARVKLAETRRLAISEEDDNLSGIRARGVKL